MSNSQLSGAKDGSGHGAFQPTSEPKDLFINTALRFWKKQNKQKNEDKGKEDVLNNVRCETWMWNWFRENLNLCGHFVDKTSPNSLPNTYFRMDMTLQMTRLAASKSFNGVQTKISSLIIITALNVNYGRAHPQLPWCLTINGLSSKWRVFQTFPANWNVWSVQSWCHRIIWNLGA